MQVTNEFLQNLRQDYKSATLDESDVDNNPITQFKKWFDHAFAYNTLVASWSSIQEKLDLVPVPEGQMRL